jgi:uridylate kinase
MGEKEFGLDGDVVDEVAREIGQAHETGVRIAVVVGGGNIFRGVSAAARGMDRVKADHMGMLATVINSLALKEALDGRGVPARVMSAVSMEPIAQPFNRTDALELLDAGRVVVLGAGTGLPYFTTDTAAALRAVEIKAEVLMKATKVDGVYDSDPVENPAAKRFDRLGYEDVIVNNLRVMDQTAVTFCREAKLPIYVFKLVRGGLKAALTGQGKGTLVADRQ